MTKNAMLRRRVSFFIILGIILVSLVTLGAKTISKQKLKKYVETNYQEEIESSKENKELGEDKSKVEYNKNTLVAIHYPLIGKKNIDKDIDKTINSYIDNFKKENKNFKAEDLKDIKTISVDYESYNFKNKLASIKLKIKEGQKDEKIHTLVYKLDEDKDLALENLLIDESLRYLSSQAIGQYSNLDSTRELMNKEDTIDSLKNDFGNYKNFILKGEDINFILPNISNKEVVSIPVDNLEAYSKLDLTTFKQLDPKKIEEKIANAQKAGIRPGLDPNKPMVALTYDDGPSSNATAAILDQLKKYDSAATFFVLGQNANIHQDLIKRMSDEGHEIGNHSYSHKQLTKLSVDGLNKEVQDTQKVIFDIVGYEPDLLRPTYGAINDRVKENVPMPLMLWSIDTLDWKYRNADRVTSSILNNVKDGDIVLMHDLYDSTKEASLRVIPELVNRGYQLVTISEMYELKGEELKAGGRYTNIK